MRKILIADDQKDFVFLLRTYLETKGYETVCVYEGIRVVEIAKKEKPDIILLDWMMPAGSGEIVLQNLKGNNETYHIPVIVVTAHGDSEVEKTSRNYGAVDFITKPFDHDQLVKIIEQHMQEETLI